MRELTQESLHAAIGMVTQDTPLLHRSIADNIRYGRPRESDAEVRAAAQRAEADVFIELGAKGVRTKRLRAVRHRAPLRGRRDRPAHRVHRVHRVAR